MIDRVSSFTPPSVKNPETRLVSEYLTTKLAAYRAVTKYPLGPTPDELARRFGEHEGGRLARPWLLEVDALVWFGDSLLLIEGKVNQYRNGIADLLVYEKALARTASLREWSGWPVRKRLVVPEAGEWWTWLADELGVEIDVFAPAWIQAYRDWRNRYWTQPYRVEREAKIEARRRMGL